MRGTWFDYVGQRSGSFNPATDTDITTESPRTEFKALIVNDRDLDWKSQVVAAINPNKVKADMRLKIEAGQLKRETTPSVFTEFEPTIGDVIEMPALSKRTSANYQVLRILDVETEREGNSGLAIHYFVSVESSAKR
jgi:hypothetical protein